MLFASCTVCVLFSINFNLSMCTFFRSVPNARPRLFNSLFSKFLSIIHKQFYGICAKQACRSPDGKQISLLMDIRIFRASTLLAFKLGGKWKEKWDEEDIWPSCSLSLTERSQ